MSEKNRQSKTHRGWLCSPSILNPIFMICTLSAMGLMLVSLLLYCFTDISPIIISAAFLAVYAIIFAWSLSAFKRAEEERRSIERQSLSLRQRIPELLVDISFPVMITNTEGVIIQANNAALRALGSTSATGNGDSLPEITGTPFSAIATAAGGGVEIRIGDSHYLARSYIIESESSDSWLIVLEDRTEVRLYQELRSNESAVVAYVVLDNLEELSAIARVSYRESANKIEVMLKEWASELRGFIREYARDKYMIVFPKLSLARCIEDKFSILDRIRDSISAENELAVTVSVGMSATGHSLLDRELEAANALDTALQRGGGQVVLRTEDDTLFFGGRLKTRIARPKVFSRVMAESLIREIEKAGNVLVMGHKSPDFDSIGSCVGIARIATGLGKEVKIVVDKSSECFKTCVAELSGTEGYPEIFVDAKVGLDLVQSGTLLILSDVNSQKIVEAPDIIGSVGHIAIIDHHRKTADFSYDPDLTYIEASASSASELVSELIEFYISAAPDPDTLKPDRHEATLMLAGIMLDTKNFTRTTSSRTFSAAYFLGALGANVETVRSFFYEDIEAFKGESILFPGAEFYRGSIIISAQDNIAGSNARISAARAADKLLNLRGVDAAFALLNDNGTIIISARSKGSVNVQLILEQIGGGGHFDVAGAQLARPMDEVLLSLREAIDEYLDQQKKD